MSLQIPPHPGPRLAGEAPLPHPAPLPRPVMVPESAAMRVSGQALSIAGLILCGVALAAAAALGSVPIWLGVVGGLCGACLLGGLVELVRARICERQEGQETQAYADQVAADPARLRAWIDQPDQGRRQGLGFWRQILATRADVLPYVPAWIRDGHPELFEAALAARPDRWMWVRSSQHLAANDPIVQGALQSLAQKATGGESLSPAEWYQLSRGAHPLVAANSEVVHALVALPIPRDPDEMTCWLRFWGVHAQFLSLPLRAENDRSAHHYVLAAAGWLDALAHERVPLDVARPVLQHIRHNLVNAPEASLVLHLMGETAVRVLLGESQSRNPTSIRIEGRASHVAQPAEPDEPAEAQQPSSQQRKDWSLLGLRAVAESENMPRTQWYWGAAWKFAAESLEQEAAEPAAGTLGWDEAYLIREAIQLMHDELARGVHGRRSLVIESALSCIPAVILEQPERLQSVMQFLTAHPIEVWGLPETISEGFAAEAFVLAMRHARALLGENPGGHLERLEPPRCIGPYPRLVEAWMNEFPDGIRSSRFWGHSHPARLTLMRLVVGAPRLWDRLDREHRFSNDLLSVLIPEGARSLRGIGELRPPEAAQAVVLQVPQGRLPRAEAQLADRIRARLLRRCGEQWDLQQRAGRFTEQQRGELEQQAVRFQRGGEGMTLDGLRAIWSVVQLDWVLDAVREECADRVEQFDSSASDRSGASSSSNRMPDEQALRLAITLGVLAEV